MKKFLFFMAFIITSTAPFSSLSAGGRPEYVYEEDDDEVIWIGPGWYGGIWIEDEDEFHDWHRRHYRDHLRGHRGEHRREHRGEHGGDGHGGSGHGGHGGHGGHR